MCLVVVVLCDEDTGMLSFTKVDAIESTEEQEKL